MMSALALGMSPPLPEIGMAKSTRPQSPGAPNAGAFDSFSDILADYVSSATGTLKTAEVAATAGIATEKDADFLRIWLVHQPQR